MAELPFLESWDHYNPTIASMRTRKWTLSGGAISVGTGRTGNCAVVDTNGPTLTLATNYASLAAGAAHKTHTHGGNILQFKNPSYNIASLTHEGGGRIKLVIFTTTYSIPFVIPTSQWFYYELLIGLSVPGGSLLRTDYTVRINEHTILTNFQLDAGTEIPPMNQFTFSGGFSWSDMWDDIYLTEGELLGDVTIAHLHPNGEGTYLQATPNVGSNHWEVVDDNYPDDDTTFLAFDSSGQKDIHEYEDLPLDAGAIKAVQVLGCVKKSDTGVCESQTLTRTATGVEASGSTFFPSDSSYLYNREGYRHSIDTGSDWTKTEVDGLEFGVQRTA